MRHNLRNLLVVAAAGAAAVLAGCERPPMEVTQTGHRGTGMAQIDNPRLDAMLAALDEIPAEPYPLDAFTLEGPTAAETYENVQVLGDLSAGQFNRLMLAITEWVVDEEYRNDPDNAAGCNYCHNPENLASDEVYAKVVSRRMLEMTQHINANWTDHVGAVGVTCHTCHRGQPVPQHIWFADDSTAPGGFIGERVGDNRPGQESVAYSSLPYDPFSQYFGSNPDDIRVQGQEALAPGSALTTMDAEHTYASMMHLSQALGVNCTFCHNTHNFAGWEDANPQRATAWYAIRMVRDLNMTYLDPLQPVYPDFRLGPTGDAPKANCATCHYGANKPLNGVNMVALYPSIAGPAQLETATAAAPEAGSEEAAADDAATSDQG